MVPFTHVGLALDAAPGGSILLESLEFDDINGLAFVFDFCPGQVLHFGDLDFVADHLT